MLRSLNGLFGSAIRAKDGELGHLNDSLFDDRAWTVRYLVVETGGWLLRRAVLIPPVAAGRPDWEKRVLPVDLTVEQVRGSPDVDMAKPVSRQAEIAMNRHYGWPAYWALEPPHLPLPDPEAEPPPEEGDPHLRSAREVLTYEAAAADGEIGQVNDLILEDANWFIRYLVVGTGSWFGGQNLLLSTRWVRSISWPEKRVKFIHSRDEM